MQDRLSFRSDRLPTQHFDARFSEDNLAFWVPRLVEAGEITPGLDVLDVGCGTGGFAREIAKLGAARVTGYDRSERFIAFAGQQPAPTRGSVEFVVGDAEQLSFAPSSFDRVLLSLVLHQLARPSAAVLEAFRVLRAGGRVLVRTIAPEDVGKRVPERYLPAMAAADAARLPRIDEIIDWLDRAGFQSARIDRLVRNKRLDFADQERELRTEVRCRYWFITDRDVADAIEGMRKDALAAEGDWIDARPTYVIVATKASSRRVGRLPAPHSKRDVDG